VEPLTLYLLLLDLLLLDLPVRLTIVIVAVVIHAVVDYHANVVTARPYQIVYHIIALVLHANLIAIVVLRVMVVTFLVILVVDQELMADA